MSDEIGYPEDNNPDSIGFIGHTSGPAEVVIDFEKPMYLIESDFGPGRDLGQMVVNAESEKAAIAEWYRRTEEAGVNAHSVSSLQVTRMEIPSDG